MIIKVNYTQQNLNCIKTQFSWNVSGNKMNSVKLKISNYRGIPIQSPIDLELKKGITFILGLNNVGKSNLLNLFYEFRNLLRYDPRYASTEVNFNNELYFDHIANRKNLQHPIRLRLSSNKHFINFEFKPNGEHHTTSLNLNYQVSSYAVADSERDSAITEMCNLFRNTLYVGASRNVIQQTSSTYFDIAVGTSFYSVWSNWAAGNDFSKINKIKALIIELKELFEYENFDIQVNNDKSNLLITTDEGIFTLDELGSGIAHFIFVLANALIKEPDYILIDEPETGLHPRLQQRFVRALASKAKFGLIATSHSIGLARSCGDHILSLSKNSKGYVKLQPFGQNYNPSISDLINEMSYSQYAELGGSKILLVEGRTDIKSFREILRKYSIEHEYIILSFGGRQYMTNDKGKITTELSELNRFNTPIAVIFDSEKESEGEEMKNEFKVFQEVCTSLGFKVFATDFHSTENYISQNAIDKVLNNGTNALGNFEKFSNQWIKEQNWLMFQAMELEEFSSTELDKFIKHNLVD